VTEKSPPGEWIIMPVPKLMTDKSILDNITVSFELNTKKEKNPSYISYGSEEKPYNLSMSYSMDNATKWTIKKVSSETNSPYAVKTSLIAQQTKQRNLFGRIKFPGT